MIGSKINHSFVEAYANEFASKICSQYFKDKATINGQQILKVTPVKQVNFLVLKNLFESWQEETRKLQSPYFNYKNDQVVKALVSFMNVLSQNIEIKAADFEKILSTSVQDCIYLMLAPFDFFWADISENDQSSASLKSFKAKSRYFKLNKHILERLIDKLEEDGIISASKEKALRAFEQIVESKTVQPEDPQEVINQFAEILPLKVDQFFENQDDDLLGALLSSEEEPEEQIGTPDVEEDGFSSYFDEEVLEEKESTPILKTEPERPSWLENTVEPSIEKSIEETPKAPEPEPEPEVQKPLIRRSERQILRREEEEEASQPEDQINMRFAKEQKTLHDQLQKPEKTTIADIHLNTKQSKMHESISVNQRYMLVNELFSGNVDAYNKAIDDIERCESFDDSVELMVQKYAKKLDWNMNSPEVKELLKVIFKRFR
jgi:hypothetical protein